MKNLKHYDFKITSKELKIFERIYQKRIAKAHMLLLMGLTSESISEDDYIDKSHLTFLIKDSVAKDVKLAQNTAVFPAFSEGSTFTTTLEEFVCDEVIKDIKKRKDPRFLKWLPKQSASTKGSSASRQNVRKEKERNAITQEVIEKVIENSDVFYNTFQFHLDVCLAKQEMFLGNFRVPKIDFKKCKQFVFPFYFNENKHLTVAVATVDPKNPKKIEINYQDSLGESLPESYENGFKAFFSQQGFVDVKVNNLQSDQQNDGHNCGIISWINAISLLNGESLENFDDQDLSYEDYFVDARKKAAAALKKRKINVEYNPTPQISDLSVSVPDEDIQFFSLMAGLFFAMIGFGLQYAKGYSPLVFSSFTLPPFLCACGVALVSGVVGYMLFLGLSKLLAEQETKKPEAHKSKESKVKHEQKKKKKASRPLLITMNYKAQLKKMKVSMKEYVVDLDSKKNTKKIQFSNHR